MPIFDPGVPGRFDLGDVGPGDDPYQRFLTSTRQTEGNLRDIAQRGIFTEDEIGNILRGSDRERALRRRGARGQIRRSFQRRLGPRAGGAAELTFVNRVLAPQFAEQLAQKRRLRETSLASRFQALLAAHGVEKSRVDAFLRRMDIESGDTGTGALDFLEGFGAIAEGARGYFGRGGTGTGDRIPDN